MTLADLPVDIGSQLKTTELAPLANEAKFNFPNFVGLAIRLLLTGIALSSFVFLLWGALQWILAGGDKDGIEKARKKITNAIIGLLITFTLFAFINLIKIMFGIDLGGNIDIPSLTLL